MKVFLWRNNNQCLKVPPKDHKALSRLTKNLIKHFLITILPVLDQAQHKELI